MRSSDLSAYTAELEVEMWFLRYTSGEIDIQTR